MGRLKDRKLEDHLIERGKKAQDMIEKKRSEMLFEQQHKHSFKPKINKNSEKMIMERSRQFLEESAAMYATPDESSQQMDSSYMTAQNKLDKFMLLYDDAIKRKQRKDQIYSKCLDSECTFTPDIAKGQLYDSRISENVDFVERLTRANKNRDRSRIKYIQEEKYDPETGQPYFHPKIGRPPLAKREPNQMPVTDKLYYDGIKRKEQKEMDAKREELERKHSTTRSTAYSKSDELIEQKKARKFHEIFLQLDSDGDGVISAEQIDISQLSPDILEIFTPLFCEMEDLEQTLDLEEFIDASMRLYDTLKLPEKNAILNLNNDLTKHKHNHESDYTFRPNINKNSLRIAQK